MSISLRTVTVICGVSILTSGCAFFEPDYPDQVTKSAAEGLQHVSSLVASAQLGDFKGPESYESAATRYADALAQIEVTRSWVSRRADGDDNWPATKAAKILASSLTECSEGVTDMAQEHQAAGLGTSNAYSLVQVTCAIPINDILQ
ncbi:hypothetical protein [Ruegeria sp. HKCCD8929]|uniref:hypothetical protein n=1 Tax=Ruegeria sp. HKCCD8929 TaxID=2683006 RepID=UPI00148950A7|nr:hypothetical protein [Ruegeria sp. HKCCD8929]